jgi:hypothetical protein
MSHGRIKLYIILFFSIRKRCQMRILLTVADVNRRLSLSSTRAIRQLSAVQLSYPSWPVDFCIPAGHGDQQKLSLMRPFPVRCVLRS